MVQGDEGSDVSQPTDRQEVIGEALDDLGDVEDAAAAEALTAFEERLEAAFGAGGPTAADLAELGDADSGPVGTDDEPLAQAVADLVTGDLTEARKRDLLAAAEAPAGPGDGDSAADGSAGPVLEVPDEPVAGVERGAENVYVLDPDDDRAAVDDLFDGYPEDTPAEVADAAGDHPADDPEPHPVGEMLADALEVASGGDQGSDGV